MGAGAAIGAGLAASAAAGVGGSLISSSAAKSAANTQSQAADQAAQLQAQQFQQTNDNLSPFRTAGVDAVNLLRGIFGSQSAPTPAQTVTTSSGGGGLPQGWRIVPGNSGSAPSGDSGYTAPTPASLVDANGNLVFSAPNVSDIQAFLGQGGGGQTTTTTTPGSPGGYTPGSATNVLTANGLNGLTFNPIGGTIFAPTQKQLESTPGYQFDLAQGQQAVANSNAAQGLGLSGAALKGAAAYATGLANNTLTTQQGIFNSNLANQQNVFQQNLGNVLNPLMWMANLGQNAAATTGQLGNQSVLNQGNLLTSGAAASAAGTVGSANALSAGLNSAAQSPLNYLLLNNSLNSGAAAQTTGVQGGGFSL